MGDINYTVVQSNDLVRIIKFPSAEVGTARPYVVQQESPRGYWIHDTDYCSWKKARSVYKTLTKKYEKILKPMKARIPK